MSSLTFSHSRPHVVIGDGSMFEHTQIDHSKVKLMQDQMLNVYHKVQQDEIINTLKESAVSKEFISDRIREIIEEATVSDPSLAESLGASQSNQTYRERLKQADKENLQLKQVIMQL